MPIREIMNVQQVLHGPAGLNERTVHLHNQSGGRMEFMTDKEGARVFAQFDQFSVQVTPEAASRKADKPALPRALEAPTALDAPRRKKAKKRPTRHRDSPGAVLHANRGKRSKTVKKAKKAKTIKEVVRKFTKRRKSR